ncbi:transcriptional regulator [Saccharibacillus sp. O23]|uniref:ROK family transcriptional regulator n=1 Tax=Saccharibacillus sp. O23 TaxID=2009338 RepID=UPI000B4E306B|nr:ROK family transcriptional regulator [Saccharibacillus sp. O23]OWR32496.1 transcriptional regulator [Saccharibacillus sp. O23]
MKRADTTLMKAFNLNAVRRVLRQKGSATKPQLAAETGLSVVTVAALVRELEERGELIEEADGTSTGGRPASVYRFDYGHTLALVMHLHEIRGVDTVMASVVDLNGQSLTEETKAFKGLNRKTFLEWVEDLLTAFPRIQAIGLGIPGQAIEGRIEVSSHERLLGLNPAELLGEPFGLPVVLENDVNAALRGYLAAGSEEGTVLGIYFPDKYPPGMAICIDGDLIAGKQGMAGEVKYLPLGIDWNSPPEGEAWSEAVCKLVHLVSVVLAPHRIVLYGDRTDGGTWIKDWRRYLNRFPLPAEPEIEWSDRFAEHFASGIREWTLKTLEPRVL